MRVSVTAHMCTSCSFILFIYLFFGPGLSHAERERTDQIFIEVTNGKAFQQRAWGENFILRKPDLSCL